MTHQSDLAQLIQLQNALQIEAYGGSPSELLDDRSPNEDVAKAVSFIHWNVTALTDELHELLGETSWKPWAKGDFVDIPAAKGEAIDALHFLLNLFIVLDMSAEEVMVRYKAKRQKNIKRQEDGYDGVSTKCPLCKRALDDDGVLCEYRPNWSLGGIPVNGVYCARFGRFTPTPEETA